MFVNKPSSRNNRKTQKLVLLRLIPIFDVVKVLLCDIKQTASTYPRYTPFLSSTAHFWHAEWSYSKPTAFG